MGTATPMSPFIRPNRDFSKGCEQKNKKNRLASQVVCQTSQGLFVLLSPRRLARQGDGPYSDIEKLLHEFLNTSTKCSLLAVAVVLRAWRCGKRLCWLMK